MLGPVASGSVRLAPIGEDSHLGIAEGIETALSAGIPRVVDGWERGANDLVAELVAQNDHYKTLSASLKAELEHYREPMA